LWHRTQRSLHQLLPQAAHATGTIGLVRCPMMPNFFFFFFRQHYFFLEEATLPAALTGCEFCSKNTGVGVQKYRGGGTVKLCTWGAKQWVVWGLRLPYYTQVLVYSYNITCAVTTLVCTRTQFSGGGTRSSAYIIHIHAHTTRMHVWCSSYRRIYIYVYVYNDNVYIRHTI